MRESCIFYKSFYDSIKKLDPQDQVQIYNAIFEYQFNGKEIELDGICESIFTLIIPQLKANNKRYENGKKGGRPKNQNETKEKPKQNQNETKTKPNVNENDNVNVNVNDKYIYYGDKKLNDIFKEFLQVRKKLKAVNSDRAINMLINKLSNYDDEVKYLMIEQSIVHSWKDVYELKELKKSGIPEWFDKKENKKEMTKEEEKEIKEMMKEFN